MRTAGIALVLFFLVHLDVVLKMTDFEHKQVVANITTDELIDVTIRNRMNAVYAQMSRNINASLYGDHEPSHSLTWMERLWRRGNIYRRRVVDAWLVLTGKADIGGDW